MEGLTITDAILITAAEPIAMSPANNTHQHVGCLLVDGWERDWVKQVSLPANASVRLEQTTQLSLAPKFCGNEILTQ